MPNSGVVRALGRAAAVVGALVLSGCYTYVPVASAPRGAPVRALLPVETRTAGGGVTRETLPVDGTVVEYGDSLVLETRSRTTVGNFREVVQVDTLRVPASELAGVQIREFSRSRTAGLGLLVAGGLAALVFAVSSAAGGSDNGGSGGNGTGASISAGHLMGLLGSLVGGR